MTNLEILVRANYGSGEISVDCREAVLAYLNRFPRSESRKLDFVKGLTNVGHSLFEQDYQSFSSSALAALIDLHEEGIAAAEVLLKEEGRVERKAVSADAFGRHTYLLSSSAHLKGHLADILMTMDFHNLFSDVNTWQQNIQKAYSLAYSAGRQFWQSDVTFSFHQLNIAAKAAYRLYEETGNIDFAEKSYHAMAGRCVVTDHDAESRKSSLNLEALQRKAFVAQSVFRNIRKNRDIPKDQLLLWGGRAYHSTRDRLLEGELLPIDRANYHYDLAAVMSTLAGVASSPHLAQRAVWYYEDFLDYVSKNNLASDVPHLVNAAQRGLQYILSDYYDSE